MHTIEKIVLVMLGLVALYLVLNAQQAGYLIAQLGQNTGGLFGVLQGGEVKFPSLNQGGGSGVQISRPANFGGGY